LRTHSRYFPTSRASTVNFNGLRLEYRDKILVWIYYRMEVISPTMTIKVAGHQWYWSSKFVACSQSFSLSNLFSLSYEDSSFSIESIILLLQSNVSIVKPLLVKSNTNSTSLATWEPKFSLSYEDSSFSIESIILLLQSNVSIVKPLLVKSNTNSTSLA